PRSADARDRARGARAASGSQERPRARGTLNPGRSIAMMKGLLSLAAGALPASVFAAAVVGQPAPAFSARDLAGNPVSLAELKGKTVVLEWHNFGCPFVHKHYDSGNMQALQKKYAADVVWITA